MNRTMEWPGYTAEGANLLNISLASSVIRGQFNSEQCEFWNEISSVYVTPLLASLSSSRPSYLALFSRYTNSASDHLCSRWYA